MEQRDVRHPKLLAHKLDSAGTACDQGNYQEAERIMADVERLVQLS
jgi:hypothetical protein